MLMLALHLCIDNMQTKMSVLSNCIVTQYKEEKKNGARMCLLYMAHKKQNEPIHLIFLIICIKTWVIIMHYYFLPFNSCTVHEVREPLSFNEGHCRDNV